MKPKNVCWLFVTLVILCAIGLIVAIANDNRFWVGFSIGGEIVALGILLLASKIANKERIERFLEDI